MTKLIRHDAGFTLIELGIVMAIAGVMVALSIPLLRTLNKSSAVASGVNTVVVSAAATRQLATTAREELDPLADGGSSEGAAMIVTNSGEVRLVQHDSDIVVTGSGASEGKGYVDIDGRDYITIPKRSGMVGIKRSSANLSGLQFVAPPFAIRFTQNGNLVFGNPSSANGAYMVYYDGDYNGTYNANRDRGTGYNPYNLTPKNFEVWNNGVKRNEVPLDEIETVIGVMVFDSLEVPELIADGPGDTNSDGYISADSEVGKAILANGTAIFFNRVTGAPVFRK